MYPIYSTLRRLPASCIYVTPAHMEATDTGYVLRLESPSEYVDCVAMKWAAPSNRVPMTELVVTAANPVAAAISMSRRETLLAESITAEQRLYTLVFGPEEETLQPDGSVVRKVRLAVIRGVYRAAKAGLTTEPLKEKVSATFRKSKPGTVRLD